MTPARILLGVLALAGPVVALAQYRSSIDEHKERLSTLEHNKVKLDPYECGIDIHSGQGGQSGLVDHIARYCQTRAEIGDRSLQRLNRVRGDPIGPARDSGCRAHVGEGKDCGQDHRHQKERDHHEKRRCQEHEAEPC